MLARHLDIVMKQHSRIRSRRLCVLGLVVRRLPPSVGSLTDVWGDRRPDECPVRDARSRWPAINIA